VLDAAGAAAAAAAVSGRAPPGAAGVCPSTGSGASNKSVHAAANRPDPATLMLCGILCLPMIDPGRKGGELYTTAVAALLSPWKT
jgi:hypothetical protein